MAWCATGVEDFNNAHGTATTRARLSVGVSAQLANGWRLSGEGYYDGIGADDFDAYGGSVRFNVPLN